MTDPEQEAINDGWIRNSKLDKKLQKEHKRGLHHVVKVGGCSLCFYVRDRKEKK